MPDISQNALLIGLGDVGTPARLQTRKIHPDVADGLRQLHRADRSLVDGGGAVWRFGTAPAGVTHGIDLGIGTSETMTLSLVADQYRDAIGERDWWDYPETTRLLAWSLAHESLLATLGRLFGETPSPRALHAAVTDATDTRLSIGFTVESANGHSAQGRLSLPLSLLQRLLAHRGWRDEATPPQPGWEMLTTLLSVQLPPLKLPMAELRQAAAGDVLIIGPRKAALGALRVTPDHPGGESWIAQARDKQLTLLHRSRHDFVTAPMTVPETRMNDPQHPTAAAHAATDPALTPLEQLPVSLEFELGRLSVTLGELTALRPGYVFELPAAADSMRVTIRANGRVIAHGELVSVGETLGVQLTALESTAAPTGGAANGNG